VRHSVYAYVSVLPAVYCYAYVNDTVGNAMCDMVLFYFSYENSEFAKNACVNCVFRYEQRVYSLVSVVRL
jgi:hypothetical protein